MCRRNGIKYFEMSHLFTQWGALHAPKIMAEVDGETKRIFGWETDSTGKEYEDFLTSLAPCLTSFLENEGIADRCYFHVSDEPGDKDIEVYGKVSGLLHRLFGEKFKFIDALSEFTFYEKGYVPLPIPCEDKIEDFYGKVPELWTYNCCGPRDNFYSNRFLSMPLQRTRIIGMQMYKYDVKGFLHWGYNFYYSHQSKEVIDPYRDTCGRNWVPGGDPFIVYPGKDGKAEDSLRHELFYDAIQDLNVMRALEKKIGRDAVIALIHEGLNYRISMTDYPHSTEWLMQLREKLNRYLAAK